ncbi:HPr kinase/phosphorylase [Aurantiacibacter rhizosphaerae]|uniref:Serine kinase n=1 Tax=Aurantiacibacter rhizosphaerae TaxID=2691582 RepID=A0A844XDN4_9SPHN|nr:HPr kinase/phosphatase C-terminal domain-containing protein [Aurantiacibacter rhizosphaerae]MWV27724.1 serine kinase [Aurantiacibacter rhizosphaerae]
MSAVIANVTCVAMRGRAMMISGPSGIGKSSLALALMDRGAELIGDDGVTLDQVGELVVATPPPNTRGLIEIRNVGLLEVPTARAPVAIVLKLTKDAERLPLGHKTSLLLGREVPLVELYPDTPYLAIRAEAALEMHGLD